MSSESVGGGFVGRSMGAAAGGCIGTGESEGGVGASPISISSLAEDGVAAPIWVSEVYFARGAIIASYAAFNVTPFMMEINERDKYKSLCLNS